MGVRWPWLMGVDDFVPEAGQVIGFNVAVVDWDAEDGDPLGILVWRLTDRRWRNTEGWGTVVLRCSPAS